MPRYSNEQLESALTAARGMVYVAARTLGCSPETMKARIEKSAALRALVQDQRGLQLDTTELKLYQAINSGDAWAIQFYLRTQGRERGYGDRQEITGADGGAIEVDTSGGLSDDQRAAAIAGLLERVRTRTAGPTPSAEPDLGAAEGPAD